MSDLTETFREATILQCGSLKKLSGLNKEEVAAFSDSIAEFLRPPNDNKFVYGLAAGRSALSLYSFLQLIQNHFDNVFPFTLEDPVQRHYRSGRNLSIAVSGSGKNKVINKYIGAIISHGGYIKLITANENGDAYKMVKNYDRGSVQVIDAKFNRLSRGKETEAEWIKKAEYLPMGTEFELAVLCFLNALFVDIQFRLKDFCDPLCQEYSSAIEDFVKNAHLISNMVQTDPTPLEMWICKLFSRPGRFIIGGVGRSGLVSRAFEMRLAHLGKTSYWENDFNRPSFQIGDVYIPITGSGNNYEALECAKTAISKGADVMPITSSSISKLAIELSGNQKDIMIIPLHSKYNGIFSGAQKSAATKLISDFSESMHPIFEIGASIFTNSLIAVGMYFLGNTEESIEMRHK